MRANPQISFVGNVLDSVTADDSYEEHHSGGGTVGVVCGITCRAEAADLTRAQDAVVSGQAGAVTYLNALSIASGVGDVYVLGAWAVRAAAVRLAATRIAVSNPHRIYSAEELIRLSVETGPYHNFPEVLNKHIFEGVRTVVSSKYVLYSQRGTLTLPGAPIYANTSMVLGGKTVQKIIGHTPARIIKGTYEIGVKPSASGRTEVITHRFFRPD